MKQPTYRERVFPDGQIHIAGMHPYTEAHGPGMRFSLWTQECPFTCGHCINPGMIPERSETSRLIKPEDLLFEIRQARDSVMEVRGITLQGGEPTIQARNLAPVLEQIRREDPSMDVLLFTGFELDFLRAQFNEALTRLLDCVDTVIDGQYEHDNRDPELIRGSKNQRIHHLSEAHVGADFGRRGQEEQFSTTGKLIRSGVTIPQS